MTVTTPGAVRGHRAATDIAVDLAGRLADAHWLPDPLVLLVRAHSLDLEQHPEAAAVEILLAGFLREKRRRLAIEIPTDFVRSIPHQQPIPDIPAVPPIRDGRADSNPPSPPAKSPSRSGRTNAPTCPTPTCTDGCPGFVGIENGRTNERISENTA